MEPIVQVATAVLKHRGVTAMLIFFTIVMASLQIEVNTLKEKIAGPHSGFDADLLAYDARVSAAVERLSRATFGDMAVQSTPLPAELQQPGRQVEAEIYRFIALGDRLTNALPTRKQLAR